MSKSESLIRAADLTTDRDGILAVLERNLPGAGRPDRFEWLYLSNPDGEARVWVAEDEDGTIVGTSAGYPRRMRIEGTATLGLVLSDFALDAAFRSLGPALRLLKATLAPIREGEYALSYDFPSESMRALYRRLGSPDLGPSERWVRLLRASGNIRRRLGAGGISSATGAAADALLSVRDAMARPPRGIEVEESEDRFDDRFDVLDAELGGRSTLVGVRDATYLSWKYGQHTMWPHRTLTAVRNGEFAGFAVFRMAEGGAVQLVDLFAKTDSDHRALVAGLVRLGRKHRAERIEIEALADSDSSRMLEGLGFVRREQSVGPVPVLSPDCPARERLSNARNWWLNGGDRDI